MKIKRFVRLSLLAILTGSSFSALFSSFGCGSVSSPVSTFGKPSSSGTSITRLDFIVDNNSVSSNTTNSQLQSGKIKAFILVSVAGSANPTIDFSFRGIGTVAVPQSTPFTGSYYASNPILLPAVLPTSATQTSYKYSDLSVMDATKGQFVDYLLATPTPPTATTPGSTPLVTTPVYYSYLTPPPSPTPTDQWFQGQFDTGTYAYTAPAKIIADANGNPLDTFALLATPEDPAVAKNASAILIHLNLTVTVTPASATLTANTSQNLGLYTQKFTANVPGDGLNRGVDWHCYQADANGNPLTAAGGKYIEAMNPANNALLIDQNGLFTAPVAQSGTTGSVAPAKYLIYAFSKTQPDKYASATVTVNQQTTSIGFQ